MGVAAPVIVAEMDEWVALGGGNSGIVGNADHTYGFHVAADELPPEDYSRWRDPNGSDGPYVNWDYACAGDFSHKNNPTLRALHADVLARLMRGEMPMVCEFIGQPWADRPVYYWARWNGVTNLQHYTGAGHDHWSHISWYRSRVDQRAYLWTSTGGGIDVDEARFKALEYRMFDLHDDQPLAPEGTVPGHQRVNRLHLRLNSIDQQLADIRAAIAAIPPGAPGGGATPDEVRAIVDEELDEAFRGGADQNG